MSGQTNLFDGDPGALGATNVDAPVAAAREPSCGYFPDAFADAAKFAQTGGDLQTAAIYRFLGILVGFQPTFDTPATPFGPWFQMEGRRSRIPSDLTPADVAVTKHLAPLANVPSLRARLFDLLWELEHDHAACAQAADAYVDAAKQLDTLDGWTNAAECFQRALHLAGKLGRAKGPFQKAAAAIQEAAKNAAGEKEEFRCCHYLRFILRHKVGDAAEFAEIAEVIAKAASAADNPYKARAYWEVAAELRKSSKNAAAEAAARLAAGETYVVQAEKRMTGNAPSALAAATLLISGIEALRRAGASTARVDELRRTLGEYQQGSQAEMKTFSAGVDISGAMDSAREYVKGENLLEALFKLALGYSLTDLEELKNTVVKMTQDHPLTHLFGTSIIDGKGRVIKQRGGLLNAGKDEREALLEEEMFSHASQFMWSLRVSSYIDPARLQIFNDHHPTFEDLAAVVSNNPFVPPGHEGNFLRGIHAGFHGDFLVAAHLLVPQIENSLRHALELHGVDVSNLKSDGTQPVKILGAIFDAKETRQIFGDALCFELRGCLIEKSGFDFRNRLSHGFVSEADCFSDAAKLIWWLVLRICLSYVNRARNARQPEGVPGEQDTDGSSDASILEAGSN